MGHHGNSFLSFGAAPVEEVGGWIELARTTLGSPTSTIDVSSLPDKRYYQILINYAASIDSELRFNGISTTTYADRTTLNGGADGTLINQNKIIMDQAASGTNARFINGYIANFSTKEKLAQFWTVKQQTAGAATAPNRTEAVGKHAQTTNPIDQMTVVNTGGNFPTGAELVVLGWDPADVHTTNFWEELDLVDLSGGNAQKITSNNFTSKKYLWIQAYVTFGSASAGANFQVGNSTIDISNIYASRLNSNGASDIPDPSATGIPLIIANINASGESGFMNCFIVNNSSEEKLGIIHWMETSPGTGAGNVPNRRELVMKWTDTSNPMDIVQLDSGAANGYGTNSIMKVWGSN